MCMLKTREYSYFHTRIFVLQHTRTHAGGCIHACSIAPVFVQQCTCARMQQCLCSVYAKVHVYVHATRHCTRVRARNNALSTSRVRAWNSTHCTSWVRAPYSTKCMSRAFRETSHTTLHACVHAARCDTSVHACYKSLQFRCACMKPHTEHYTYTCAYTCMENHIATAMGLQLRRQLSPLPQQRLG